MSGSTPGPKWTLPTVANWDFIRGAKIQVSKRKAGDWKGIVVFVNEEGRHIKIAVQWNEQAIGELQSNLNRLRKLPPFNGLPPHDLNHAKACTEHYCVEETARLGGLEVRIMGAPHDVTLGTGQQERAADSLHVTCHIKTAEWGQKKSHLYLAKNWDQLAKARGSVVFVKDHHTLGLGNATGVNKKQYRAFWHPNLSYGYQPSWLFLPAPTNNQTKDSQRPSYRIHAQASYQYVEARADQISAAVERTEGLPLKACIATLGQGSMYTRFSQIVQKEFGTGAGRYWQMDYGTETFHEMKKNGDKWARAQSPQSGEKK